jgi:DNA-binding NarL/FixJ family response regulator
MVQKFLLIDDEAEKGWGEILKKILQNKFGKEIRLEVKSDPLVSWEELDKEKYKLIFLDLRFGEEDHYNDDFTTLTGYRLLQKFRSEGSTNFSTPIIVFTASTKIWIIEELLQIGADSYYIKESPLHVYDQAFTRKNTDRFLKQIDALYQLSVKRELIWNAIQKIVDQTNTIIANEVIRTRIKEKLKIGYGILFQSTTTFQREKFFYTNEVLAYIVFWSILEEICKDFYIVDWDQEPKEYSWKLRSNGRHFIEDKVSDNPDPATKVVIIANYRRGADNPIEAHAYNEKDDLQKFMKKHTRDISLSDQVVGILYLHHNWDYGKIRLHFLRKLNAYRNRIDFIHSDPAKISSQKVSESFDAENSLQKCNEILDFIKEILSNKHSSHRT